MKNLTKAQRKFVKDMNNPYYHKIETGKRAFKTIIPILLLIIVICIWVITKQ